jgi:Spy/CpxP family protein refolding chaperone
MKLTKLSLIAALALGGLLACSTLASAQDSTATPKQGKRGGPPSLEQQLDMLKDSLKLTDEQVPKVKTVIEDSLKKRADLRADTSLSQEDRRTKMQAIVEDQHKKMKEILTAEQFEKYQKSARQFGKRGPGGPGAPGIEKKTGTNQ